MSSIAFFIPHLGCPQMCSFCNQKVISGKTEAIKDDDIRRECEKALEYLGARAENMQISFFGGSFTAIPRGEMEKLLAAAEPYVEKGAFSGIRISTRPDAVDEEITNILIRYKVRTVELGAQSMDDSVLMLNRRGHTSDDVRKSSRLLKDKGFELVLQMMTGLYGDSLEKTLYTANEFIRLGPDAVRIYPTVVLKGTMLEELYSKGEYFPPDPRQAAETGAVLLDMFEKAGIPVIKFGLHASKEVECQSVAGAYHPALRELAEAERYYKKIMKKISDECIVSHDIEIRASRSTLGRLRGHKNENLSRLKKSGYNVRLKEDERSPEGEFYINLC